MMARPSPTVVTVGTEDIIYILLILNLERQPQQVSLADQDMGHSM